jgi:hypothetical protein
MIESRWMIWARHVACKGREGMRRILMGKTEGKRPQGKAKHRWTDEQNSMLKTNFALSR